MTATFEEHTGPVNCISFAPNGEFFASGAEDKTVIVYNLVFSLIVTTFKVNVILFLFFFFFFFSYNKNNNDDDIETHAVGVMGHVPFAHE